MQDYTKLNIWTNSHELVLKIYKITEEYYLLLAKDLNYISEELFQELKEEVVIIRKSIISLTKKI